MLVARAGCHPLCRTCGHKELSLQDSLDQKEAYLRKTLSPWKDRIGRILHVPELDAIQYRDKVCLAARWENDAWKIGTMRDTEVIPIPGCPIHTPRVRDTLRVLLRAMPGGSGFPLVYVAQSGAQVTLVLKTREHPGMSWLKPKLFSDLARAGASGLWLHLHPSAGRRIFLKTKWELVWGSGYSVDAEGFRYGPTSFRQLMPGLHAESLDYSARFLEAGAGCVVTDLYCGIGASLARWTSSGAAAIGVELSGEAAGFAALNVPGAAVLRGKCSERLPQIDAFVAGHPGHRELVYANPPRTGLEDRVVKWIGNSLRPEKIAYLSCSAGTLARDLKALEGSQYVVRELIPLDFFPFTRHVECLAHLDRY